MQFSIIVRTREIFLVGQIHPPIQRTNVCVNMRSGFIHAVRQSAACPVARSRAIPNYSSPRPVYLPDHPNQAPSGAFGRWYRHVLRLCGFSASACRPGRADARADSESSVPDPGKAAGRGGPFLINVTFDPSFPVEMFGEAGNCTGTERLQVHGC